MLVKFNFKKYALSRQALKILTDLAYKVIQDYISGQVHSREVEQALKERAYYNVPIAVLHGAFKARYANSQQNAYLTLKNNINPAISTLFNNHSVNVATMEKDGNVYYSVQSSFEIDAKQAIKPFMFTVRRVYERRLERSILKGKDTINLISNNTLTNFFFKAMRKPSNSNVVHDVVSTIHSIWQEIQESEIDIDRFSNDYIANMEYMRSYWYDCKITKYRFTDNLEVREEGIFTKRSYDGQFHCHCRFRSHIFNGNLFNDSWYFSTDKNGNVIVVVLQYRSLGEVVYSIANRCIDRNRRSYTSTSKEIQNNKEETSEIDLTDCVSYDEKGYINIEEGQEELRNILLSALVKNGMSYKKVVPFLNCLFLNKVDGIHNKTACEYGGLSPATFYRYWKDNKALIGKVLSEHKKGKETVENTENYSETHKREKMVIAIEKKDFTAPKCTLAHAPDSIAYTREKGGNAPLYTSLVVPCEQMHFEEDNISDYAKQLKKMRLTYK